MKRFSLMLLLAIFAISCKDNPAKIFFDSGLAKMKTSTDSIQQVKNYKAALKDFDRAIELDPNYIDAYKKRGPVRNYLGDYSGCLQDCEKVLEIDPSMNSVYLYIATIKWIHNDPQGTISAISKFIDRDANNPDGYLQRALAEEKIKDYNASLKDFNKLIEHMSPDNIYYKNSYSLRGDLKLKLNDKNGACDDFHKALQLGYTEAQHDIDLNCK